MAKAPGLFGGAMRLSAQRRLTPEEEAAQQARPRRSMGEMASGLPSASPLFGGQMMRELPQQKQQQPQAPQPRPSLWDGIVQDPLAFLLTGPRGVSQRQNADAKMQASAAQRQARIEQANTLGMKGREAALFVDANEDYYKNYAENMKPTTLSKGQLFLNGDGTKTFNADTGVSEGQAWQTDETGKTLWGQRQATTPEETNAAAVTAETARNNNMVNSLGRDRLAMDSEKATAKPTPMQTAVDKNWADDLVNWQINGSANFGKQMMQLDGAVARLKSGEELTGPGTTFLPGPMRDLFGQAGKDVQQQIQEIVQGSLREVLGAQFTQKEGEGIMARTFDPTLEEGVNAQRAERLVAQLKLAAQQKNAALEYYNQNGTMNGYQGKVPSVADFNAAIDGGSVGGDGSITAPNGQTFTREKSVAVRNFMKSLPKSMQDPQFMAQLDNLLGQSSSPAQQTGAPPPGVDPEDWKYFTPEMKQQYLGAVR